MRRNCGILAHIRNLYRISMKVGTPRLPLLLLLLRAGWAGGAVGKSFVAWWLLMIKSLRSEEGKKGGSVISSKARINSLCLMQPEYTRSGVCVWCGRDKLAHINGGVCSCGGSRWREEVFFFSFILVAGIIVAAGKAASRYNKVNMFRLSLKKMKKKSEGGKQEYYNNIIFVRSCFNLRFKYWHGAWRRFVELKEQEKKAKKQKNETTRPDKERGAGRAIHPINIQKWLLTKRERDV